MTATNNAHQFQVRIKAIEAHGLSHKDKKSNSDPFVTAKLKGIKQMMSSVKSSVVNNSSDPVWNQELDLFVPSVNDVLLLKVYDKDPLKSALLGMVEVPLNRFYQQGINDQWLQLMKRKGGWKKLIGQAPIWFTVPGSLHVQIWFGSTTEPFPGFGSYNNMGNSSGMGMGNNSSMGMGNNSSMGMGTTSGVGMGNNSRDYNNSGNYNNSSMGMGNTSGTGMGNTSGMGMASTSGMSNNSGNYDNSGNYNNSGSTSSMNTGMANTTVTPVITPVITPVVTSGSSGMNSGMGNTTMQEPVIGTPIVTDPLLADLEAPNYHGDDWSSKDMNTGFQPVSPARFQWYTKTSATAI